MGAYRKQLDQPRVRGQRRCKSEGRGRRRRVGYLAGAGRTCRRQESAPDRDWLIQEQQGDRLAPSGIVTPRSSIISGSRGIERGSFVWDSHSGDFPRRRAAASAGFSLSVFQVPGFLRSVEHAVSESEVGGRLVTGVQDADNVRDHLPFGERFILFFGGDQVAQQVFAGRLANGGDFTADIVSQFPGCEVAAGARSTRGTVLRPMKR